MAQKSKEAAAIILRCAADEINRFGLHKGSVWPNSLDWDPLKSPPPAGSCCAGGAIYKAMLCVSDHNLAGHSVAGQYFERFIRNYLECPVWNSLGAWNDTLERTANEVVQALLEAAQLLEEGEL